MSKMPVKAVKLVRFLLVAMLFSGYFDGFLIGLSAASESSKSVVVAIVDSRTYDGIEASLQQYEEDVERSGFLLNITETDNLANQTKEGVKAWLQGFWESGNENVSGALLIGDVPEAWFETGARDFPTDMYYMDLNGIWMDTDGNGIFDGHSGDLDPEIWVGRLKVSTVSGDAVALLNKYFEKNHRYRNNLSPIPWWRALLYMDDFGVAQGHDALTPLHYIAPETVTVTSGVATNAEDYRQRLQDEVGYQWLYLMCHGNTANHTFQVPSPENYYEWDGTMYSSDYDALDPRISFYHFFVCSAGRYAAEDYLAGAAVFRNDYGLLAVASTDDSYTCSYNDFYEAMSRGETVGRAFLQWLGNAVVALDEQTGLVGNEFEILIHDTVLIGDPTLDLHIEDRDLRVVDVRAVMQNASGAETLVVSLTIQNAGDFSEILDVTVHVDSDLVYQNRLTLDSGGEVAVTFSPKNASKYIWSDFIHHRVRVEVSSLPQEFDVENNVFDQFFVSKKIYRSWLMQLPDAVFALIGIVFFGMICFGFMRLLMADRPLYQVQKLLARAGIWMKAILLRKG